MWGIEKRKWWLVGFMFLLALFFAALTLRSVQQYLDKEIQKVEAQGQIPMVKRVVFNKNLTAGAVLEANDLAIREVPLEYISAQSVAPKDYQPYIGQMLKYSVQAGELLMPFYVEPVAQPAFSRRIQSGRRALSITVDRVNSISGLVRPGDLIDIYVSFDYQRRRITAPLLQGVYVLATDQNIDDRGTTQKSITTLTLDLSPEDAAKLVAAKQSAEITAMLRNPIDADTSVKAVRNDIATLLGLRNPIENLNQSRTVNIIYGNHGQGKNTLTALRPQRVYRAPPAVFDLTIPFQMSHEHAEWTDRWIEEHSTLSEDYAY